MKTEKQTPPSVEIAFDKDVLFDDTDATKDEDINFFKQQLSVTDSIQHENDLLHDEIMSLTRELEKQKLLANNMLAPIGADDDLFDQQTVSLQAQLKELQEEKERLTDQTNADRSKSQQEIDHLKSQIKKLENDMKLQSDEAACEIELLHDENIVIKRKLHDFQNKSVSEHDDLLDERDRLTDLVSQLQQENAQLVQQSKDFDNQITILKTNFSTVKINHEREAEYSRMEKALRAETELLLLECEKHDSELHKLQNEVQQNKQHDKEGDETEIRKLKAWLHQIERTELALRTEIEEIYIMHEKKAKQSKSQSNVTAEVNSKLLSDQVTQTEKSLCTESEELINLHDPNVEEATAVETPTTQKQNSSTNNELIQPETSYTESHDKLQEYARTEKRLRSDYEEQIISQVEATDEALSAVGEQVKSEPFIPVLSTPTISDLAHGQQSRRETEKSLRQEIEDHILLHQTTANELTKAGLKERQILDMLDDANSNYKTIMCQYNQLKVDCDQRQVDIENLQQKNNAMQLELIVMKELTDNANVSQKELCDLTIKYNMLKVDNDSSNQLIQQLHDVIAELKNDLTHNNARLEVYEKSEQAQRLEIEQLLMQQNNKENMNEIIVTESIPTHSALTQQSECLKTTDVETQKFPEDYDFTKRTETVERALRLEIEGLLVEHDGKVLELKIKEADVARLQLTRKEFECSTNELTSENNALREQLTSISREHADMLSASHSTDNQLESTLIIVDQLKNNITNMEIDLTSFKDECELMKKQNHTLTEEINRMRNELLEKPVSVEIHETVNALPTESKEAITDNVSEQELEELTRKNNKLKVDNESLRIQISKLKLNGNNARAELEMRREIEELIISNDFRKKEHASEQQQNTVETAEEEMREEIEDLQRQLNLTMDSIITEEIQIDMSSLVSASPSNTEPQTDESNNVINVQLQGEIQQLKDKNATLETTIDEMNTDKAAMEQNFNQLKQTNNSPRDDSNYMLQLEQEVHLLKDTNRALATDVSQLQYRLAQQQTAIEGLVDVDGSEEQEYLHRKLKEFSLEASKHAAEMADMEERQRIIKRQMKQMQLENCHLAEENDTLREVTQLRRLPPKELVSRLRTENAKLHEFVQMLETRLKRRISPIGAVQQPATTAAGSGTMTDSRSMVRLLSEDLTVTSPQSYSETVMANTVEECHKEIERLRRSHQESDKKYREVIATYRAHLLAMAQGRVDTDVRDALQRIVWLRDGSESTSTS